MAASRIRIAASSLRLHLSMLMLFRHRVTSPDGVEEQLRDRLAHRTENFLESAERLVFANPRSRDASKSPRSNTAMANLHRSPP